MDCRRGPHGTASWCLRPLLAHLPAFMNSRTMQGHTSYPPTLAVPGASPHVSYVCTHSCTPYRYAHGRSRVIARLCPMHASVGRACRARTWSHRRAVWLSPHAGSPCPSLWPAARPQVALSWVQAPMPVVLLAAWQAVALTFPACARGWLGLAG